MLSNRIKYWLRKLAIGVVTLLMHPLHSQPDELKTIHNSDSPYPYWLYLPENFYSDSTANWPVIVFLHGRSLSGTDLNLVTKYGLISEIKKGRKIPAIIIAPQVKRSSSWNPDSVIKCLKTATTNYKVDTNRIAITGMSLGGYGTLHTAGKYPQIFSAAAAFCGGGNLNDGCNLSTIPVWIAHGKKDKAVPFRESLKMVKSIQKCNPNKLLFTVFKRHNHAAMARMYTKEELYQFLLMNSKNKDPFFPKFKKQRL